MTLARLLLKNLRYHWRGNLAVALGVVVGTAVLTGALLVGDSLRGSLRALALEQLGWVDQALVTSRFFRQELAGSLPAERVAPAIMLRGSASLGANVPKDDEEDAEAVALRRIGNVNVLAVDDRFWAANVPQSAAFWRASHDKVMVNATLAEALSISRGGTITLHLQKADNVPRETLLGKKQSRDVVLRLVVKVEAVLPDRDLGRFSLKPSPEPPRNVFVPLSFLQEKLELKDRVNALLVAGPGPALAEKLRGSLTLEDWNLTLRTPADRARSLIRYLTPSDRIPGDQLGFGQWNQRVPVELARMAGGVKPLKDTTITDFYRRHRAYVSLESPQMFLEPAVERAADELVRRQPNLRAGPTLVYLADTITDGRKEIPYAVIAAVDTRAPPPLGPFQDPAQPPLGEDEIILADLDAATGKPLSPLRAQKDDKLTLIYYLPDAGGRLEKTTRVFRLRDVITLKDAADDLFLTPEFPGITDKPVSDWKQKNLPFPYEPKRTAASTEGNHVNNFSNRYRTTPRAYVSLQAGQELWKNRFGKLTSIRFAAVDGDLESAEKLVRSGLPPLLKPEQGGFVFDDVKQRGLQAGAGSTDFGMYFLAFSFFLIAAALLLVGLLVRLNIDRRAAEIGVLLATGFRPGTVRRLLLAEGCLLAAVGGLIGLAGAVGYASILLDWLTANWPGEQLTFLGLHVTPASLAIGYVASLAVSALTIAWTLRVLGKISPSSLLAGETTAVETSTVQQATSWSAWIARGALVAAVAFLAIAFIATGHMAQALSFFGSGAFLLTAALAGIWSWMRRSRRQAMSIGPGALTRLGARNAARHPVRSVLTVGLLGSATFMVVAVESFHKEAGHEFFQKEGGSGGFRLVAETDVPAFQDLNDPKVRKDLKAVGLGGAVVHAFNLRAGDDASCLNLYQPLRPRILGVPESLIQRGGFSFSAGVGKPGSPEEKNPWLLLHQPQPDGAIPVIVDANSAQYILKVGLGDLLEVPDENGDKRKLRVVALLAESIFQSEVLMAREYFQNLYRFPGGFQFFLVECEPSQLSQVKSVLESALGNHGLVATPSEKRLEAYLAVENTYLATFQALGGLGLLLGALGLAVVLARSVWERRGELALLRALGFRRRALGWLVLAENGYLLILGLAVGTGAALVAIAPHLTGGILWLRLALLLAVVLVAGLAAATAAVIATLRAPLLIALRRE